MNRIYFEPGVLVARPDVEFTEAAITPDAGESLRNLAETGHELVMVSGRPMDLPGDFPPMHAVPHIDDASDGSWFLTTDPELCGPRQANLRTVLVGPGPGTHKATVQRCDVTTRDLRAAVLEILAREAMTPVA
jgi:hypothetical protein